MVPFMLYRFEPLMLGLVGRRVGSGGAVLEALFDCMEPLSETDVFGVVPVVVPSDASVEELSLATGCLELSDLTSPLDFRRKLCHREGMRGNLGANVHAQVGDQGRIGDVRIAIEREGGQGDEQGDEQ